ncbi:MAG: MmcQ/YjbR family DNA-binding protein [Devosia sp.]
MSLHALRSFDAFVLSLPATTLVEQWGGHVGKVGGKVFVLCGVEGGQLVFKVSEMSFEGLTALPGVEQAPYFAKRHWVSVARGALPDADLKAYIRRSHETVAAGLTRKLRTELGLTT